MPDQDIKIAKMETRMDQLQRDMTEIKADIKDIKGLVGGLDDRYIRKDDYEKDRAPYKQFLWYVLLFFAGILLTRFTDLALPRAAATASAIERQIQTK